MAVHVPLSAEAQAEARFLMLAANNLLKPSDGRPVAVPTQDMVLGSYYLTMVRDENNGNPPRAYRDFNEAIMAYNEGAVTLHNPIRVRNTIDVGGRSVTRMIETTVGRIIFNTPIPQDLGYVDRTKFDNLFELEVSFLVRKKELGDIIDRCIRIHGTAKTAEVLDEIKSQGFKYSTKGAITVAITDAVIPDEKKELLAAA
jgi:DNA-directed RNA polymerase subunit beta'